MGFFEKLMSVFVIGLVMLALFWLTVSGIIVAIGFYGIIFLIFVIFLVMSAFDSD